MQEKHIFFSLILTKAELLALYPSDFDFANNRLNIKKTYKRIKKQDVISTPKTENSVRSIVIPEFLKQEIQHYLSLHYEIPDDERIFPMVDRTVQKRFKKHISNAGVKNIRVHDLRHSHVAYLIYKGVQPLIIKERLGHKDIQITLNTYGHLYPSQQTMVADMPDDARKSAEKGNAEIENALAGNKDISK